MNFNLFPEYFITNDEIRFPVIFSVLRFNIFVTLIYVIGMQLDYIVCFSGIDCISFRSSFLNFTGSYIQITRS